MFLKGKNQKWLKIIVPNQAYQNLTNSPMLYIEWGTGQFFYKDLKLTISLAFQEHISRQKIAPLDPPHLDF